MITTRGVFFCSPPNIHRTFQNRTFRRLHACSEIPTRIHTHIAPPRGNPLRKTSRDFHLPPHKKQPPPHKNGKGPYSAGFIPSLPICPRSKYIEFGSVAFHPYAPAKLALPPTKPPHSFKQLRRLCCMYCCFFCVLQSP